MLKHEIEPEQFVDLTLRMSIPFGQSNHPKALCGVGGAAPAGLFVWTGRGSARGVRVAATRVQQTPDFTWFVSAKVLQKSGALDAM